MAEPTCEPAGHSRIHQGDNRSSEIFHPESVCFGDFCRVTASSDGSVRDKFHIDLLPSSLYILAIRLIQPDRLPECYRKICKHQYFLHRCRSDQLASQQFDSETLWCHK